MPERPTRHTLAALLWANIAVGMLVLVRLVGEASVPAGTVGAIVHVALLIAAAGGVTLAILKAGRHARARPEVEPDA